MFFVYFSFGREDLGGYLEAYFGARMGFGIVHGAQDIGKPSNVRNYFHFERS